MEDFNRSLQPAEAGAATVTANCYAGHNNAYRPATPESPIDPRLSPNPDDVSPTQTRAIKKLRNKDSRTQHADFQHQDSFSSEPTLTHADSHDSADLPPIHSSKSKRDTWYHSKDSLTPAEVTGIPVRYNPEITTPFPVTTRSRKNSTPPTAPQSPPTSRGRLIRPRPATGDTQRSFYHTDDDSDHHAITTEAHRTESLSSLNYPGRLDMDSRPGLTQTESGRETYLPDGLVEQLRDRSVERSAGRRVSGGSASGRRYSARDAGRAH